MEITDDDVKKIQEISRELQPNEGTIRKDSNGHRYIFRNGLWYGMCYIDKVDDTDGLQ